MVYTHLIEFEAEELVNAGFEYVCDFNEEGKLFRKRK
jgi:hypothetical protein